MNSYLRCLTLAATLLAVGLHAADTASSPLDAAKAALQRNELDAAATLLEPLTTGEKPNPAALHQLGLVRLRQKRTADAVALHEKATALDATKPDYFSALGLAISQRMGEVTFMQQATLSGKLRRAFAKSVELDPNHISGLIGLARFYGNAPEIAGGSVEKAQELAERVQKLNPFLGAIELAAVAEKREDFAAAVAQYDTAAQLQPKNAGPQVSAARALIKLKRSDDARARLKIALELDPARESAKKLLAQLDGAPAAK